MKPKLSVKEKEIVNSFVRIFKKCRKLGIGPVRTAELLKIAFEKEIGYHGYLK